MCCPGRDWGDSDNSEALPGVLGNRGTKAYEGNKGTQAILGNIENQDFVFGEQGHFFEGNKGTGTPPPPPGGPQFFDEHTHPEN